jgi:tetratricopeptide (TPR) repeat protein
MQHGRTLRSALLGLGLLGACAALSQGAARGEMPVVPGDFGAFLNGRLAANQLRFGAAAQDFLRALAADPDNPDLILSAFLACAMDGRPEAAELARHLPGNVPAQLVLADRDAVAGDWDAAAGRFAALPDRGLTQILRPILVAWAQAGAGRPDQAIAGLSPGPVPAASGVFALNAAVIADLAGHAADAARLYDEAGAKLDGINLRFAQILANWQARQGRPAEAKAIFRRMLRTNPDLAIAGPTLAKADMTRPVAKPTDGIAEAYLAMAGTLHLQDGNDYALLLLRLALQMRPDLTPARILAAEIQDGSGQAEAARDTLRAIAADDPLMPLVRLRLASLNQRLGDPDSARKELDILARRFPDRPEPQQALGDLLRGQGKPEEAVAAYDRALARMPRHSRADWTLLYSRGVALDAAHAWPRAEADLEHALQIVPDQPMVLNYLGYSWVEQGRNLARARQMIERAVALRPNDGNLVDSLGWAMLRQGDKAGAVRELERAAEMSPGDALINAHLGDAYWAADRRREAEFQWRRALTLNPPPDDAARLQAKLREAPLPPGTREGASADRTPAAHRVR